MWRLNDKGYSGKVIGRKVWRISRCRRIVGRKGDRRKRYTHKKSENESGKQKKRSKKAVDERWGRKLIKSLENNKIIT